jgi:putative transposase
MARLPRIVLPGIPHHVTQRGNRRERTFFEDGDYELCLDLLADTARRARWRWTSARALCDAANDGVVSIAPVLERVGDFTAFLDEAFDEAFAYAALRKAESIGRPVGSPEWLEDMETRTGLSLKPKKRGPKQYLTVK